MPRHPRNESLTRKELQRLRLSVNRGRPYGTDRWVADAVAKMDLLHTVRPEARPRKDARINK